MSGINVHPQRFNQIAAAYGGTLVIIAGLFAFVSPRPSTVQSVCLVLAGLCAILSSQRQSVDPRAETSAKYGLKQFALLFCAVVATGVFIIFVLLLL
jgi:hypothetical protein